MPSAKVPVEECKFCELPVPVADPTLFGILSWYGQQLKTCATRFSLLSKMTLPDSNLSYIFDTTDASAGAACLSGQ